MPMRVFRGSRNDRFVLRGQGVDTSSGAGARYAVLVTKRSDLVRGRGGLFSRCWVNSCWGSGRGYQETRKEGGALIGKVESWQAKDTVK